MLKNTFAVKSIQKYLENKFSNENLIYSELLKQIIWLLTNFVRLPDNEVGEPRLIEDSEFEEMRIILDLMMIILRQFDTLMPASQNDLFLGLSVLCRSGNVYML